MANLSPNPKLYDSSRPLFDVLIGDDATLPLIEASVSDDDTILKSMLAQPQWTKIALEKPHIIYSERRRSKHENDVRTVTARPMLNVERLIIKAAETRHAEAVSTLLSFASQQGLGPSSVISYYALDKTITSGQNNAVMEALISADPGIVNSDLLRYAGRPLRHALKLGKTGIVATLLKHGADPKLAESESSYGGNDASLLCLAAKWPGPHMTEVLLQHGVDVNRSGALHMAAEHGALDTMRLLMEHGADVDELLPRDTLAVHEVGDLWASWTPLHFAASGGQVDAMKLLKSNGARSADVKDISGKTPTQLLEEQRNNAANTANV
jgi:ankyrin repeat protein